MRVLAERRIPMRRIALICVIALAVWAKSAHAGSTDVTLQATPTSGPIPLAVTFTASGDGVAYHWVFGDGTEGDGATAQHTYTTAGRYTAVVTSTSFGGGSTGQASVDITAYALSLRAPSPIGSASRPSSAARSSRQPRARRSSCSETARRSRTRGRTHTASSG